MNQVKSIFKNTSWMSLSQVVTSLCAFLWTILIANYLGVTDYGIVSFAISFTTLINIVMDLGMSTYITREISKNNELLAKYMGNIFLFKLLLAILLLIVSIVILVIMGKSNLTIIVTTIFTIEMVFMSMVGFLNGVFQAFEKVKYQAIGNILNSSFLLIGILITLGLNLGVISVAISYLIGYLVFFVYMCISYIKKFSFPKFELDLDFIKEVLIGSLPFGLTNFFYSIYFSIDIVMLSYLSGDYATGLYKSAYNIINIFTTFFVVYQAVVFPVMSKFFAESKDLLKVSYEVSVKYLLLIIIPLSIGVYYYALPLVDLIYNNQYSLASTPVQILIWTVVFLFVNGAASTLLNSVSKERIVTKVYIIAALFNIVLNMVMIPIWGYEGAALTTVLSEILICILTTYYIFKTDYHPGRNLLKNIIKLVICGAVLMVVLYYINVSMWLAIPISLVIYIIMILLTKTLDDNDRFIIKSLFDKN